MNENPTDAEEQFNLGTSYVEGNGVPKDLEKAIYWYAKAAEQGHSEAQLSLGIFYTDGIGVPKDIEKAIYWFTKAAEQGRAEAQYNLGICYDDGGNGVPKDMEKAIYWYTKAVEQGNAMAQCNLGACYAQGNGVPKDLEKAIYWYTKAAEQGSATAQCNLGVRYANGNGVAKDLEKAIYWYTKAAEQGNAMAQYNLGTCYAYGDGIPTDMEKAIHWFAKAAEQDIAEAQYNLGVCYANGTGVAKDLEKAIYWYTKAAEQGMAEADEKAEKVRILKNANSKYAGIKCKSHPSKEAYAHCDECGEPICGECYIVLLGSCYKCASSSVKNEATKYKKQRRRDNYKRILVIISSTIGALIGIASAEGKVWSTDSIVYTLYIWIWLGISGNLIIALSFFPQFYRSCRDNGESFGQALKTALFAVILFKLLPKSLAGPIIPIIKIWEYTKNIKIAKSTISDCKKLLRKMSDYYGYAQYVEKHGDKINHAKLTEQGGALYNNEYAKAILNGNQETYFETETGLKQQVKEQEPSKIGEKKKLTFGVIFGIALGTVIAIAIFINNSFNKSSKPIEVNKTSTESETFTDPRDNQTYRTIKIGTQTWMAENLNYGVKGSKCYNNEPANCEEYGQLYNWSAALKACPSGWHLPSNDEWEILYRFVDGTSGTEKPYSSKTAGRYLKAKSGWNYYEGSSGNGTDDYGFTALPGGLGHPDGKLSSAAGSYGNWWSSSEYDDNSAYNRFKSYKHDNAGWETEAKSKLFSVRCVKDEATASAEVKSAAKSTAKPFTDPRDNRTYKTTKIGNQTWMAENLKYEMEGSKCYDHEPANCQKYGILYNWEPALKACPSGWHLPKDYEWAALADYIGSDAGKKLKSTSGWDEGGNGTDEYGFSALPAGSGKSDGSFIMLGKYGYWWSVGEGTDDYYRYVSFEDANLSRLKSTKKGSFPIRCVKD